MKQIPQVISFEVCVNRIKANCIITGYEYVGPEGEYTTVASSKFRLYCRKHNKEFVCSANDIFIYGNLCPDCRIEVGLKRKATHTLTAENAEEKLKKICELYGNEFRRFVTPYTNFSNTIIEYYCPKHDELVQVTLRNFITMKTFICKKCSLDGSRLTDEVATSRVINKCAELGLIFKGFVGGKYVNEVTKLIIYNPTTGETGYDSSYINFVQQAKGHWTAKKAIASFAPKSEKYLRVHRKNREAQGRNARRRLYTEEEWKTRINKRKVKYQYEDIERRKKAGKTMTKIPKEHWHKGTKVVICDTCGKRFLRKIYNFGINSAHRYCSAKCRVEGRKIFALEANKDINPYLNPDYGFRLCMANKNKITFPPEWDIDRFLEKSVAFEKFDSIIEKNHSEVLLPRKDCNYELILLQLHKKMYDSIYYPNEMGKMVNTVVESNDDKRWIIFNKKPYYIEQTFLINKIATVSRRFKIVTQEILNRFVLDCVDKRDILLYHNFIIVKRTIDDIDFISAFKRSYIIDLYNYLKKYCEERNYFHVRFMGTVDHSPTLCEHFSELIKIKITENKKR
jgi:hypothetical protein